MDFLSELSPDQHPDIHDVCQAYTTIYNYISPNNTVKHKHRTDNVVDQKEDMLSTAETLHFSIEKCYVNALSK